MTIIRFERHEERLRFLNPLKGFEEDTQQVEVRKDPLLGYTSVYNPFLVGKFKMFVGDVDRGLIERLAAETAATCIFCPERIAGTARYPSSLLPEGQVRVGQAVVFPNLFALAKYHAVAVVSTAHFLELNQFRPDLIRDAFQGLQHLARRIWGQDESAVYATVHANYLFPAGASLVHPHFQMLLTAEPYTHHAALLEAGSRYFRRHGRSYHNDLVVAEQALGVRYVGRTGDWHWLTTFAPLGSNEFLGIHDAAGDFLELTDADVSNLAKGLSSVLRCYERLGHLSFNFTLYGRRSTVGADGFNSLIRVITRQNPYPNYRTDDFFLQKGLQTELILIPPEELADRARDHGASWQ